MDRISATNLAAVLAGIEAVALAPPDDLTGEARVMFESIAANNRSRPWNQSHAYALADYCRVAVLWNETMRAVATEGSINAKGKPNARLRVAQMLSMDRLRLGKLLGLHVGAKDRYLTGGGKAEESARSMGAAMARAKESDGGDLLA